MGIVLLAVVATCPILNGWTDQPPLYPPPAIPQGGVTKYHPTMDAFSTCKVPRRTYNVGKDSVGHRPECAMTLRDTLRGHRLPRRP